MFRVKAGLTNAALIVLDAAVVSVVQASVGEGPLLPFLAGWISMSAYFGMYHSRRMNSPMADLATLAKTAVATWFVLECLALVSGGGSTPRYAEFIVGAFVALAVVRFTVRLTLRELRRHGYNLKNLVVVASGEVGERLETRIRQRAHYGYHIAHRFVYDESTGAAEILARFDQLLRFGRIDDVILALPSAASDLAGYLVATCESHGVNVRIVPDLSPLIRAETQVYDLDGIPLVNARLYPTEYFGYAVIKRLFDVCFSLAALILLSPLFVFLAVLVKATSPGPVLFSQERVGLNGRKFRMLKFRTMRQSPSLDPDSHWTVCHDSNVTAAGRWLRRFNLDELPQFINVLKGEMSIVGPRPERPFFLERFRREVPGYMARHYVKSGMTGWAQVHGWRGDTEIPQRVAHDLYYIRNWAVALDFKILALTLRTFFQRNTG